MKKQFECERIDKYFENESPPILEIEVKTKDDKLIKKSVRPIKKYTTDEGHRSGRDSISPFSFHGCVQESKDCPEGKKKKQNNSPVGSINQMKVDDKKMNIKGKKGAEKKRLKGSVKKGAGNEVNKKDTIWENKIESRINSKRRDSDDSNPNKESVIQNSRRKSFTLSFISVSSNSDHPQITNNN